jgi:hypothetical protein
MLLSMLLMTLLLLSLPMQLQRLVLQFPSSCIIILTYGSVTFVPHWPLLCVFSDAQLAYLTD